MADLPQNLMPRQIDLQPSRTRRWFIETAPGVLAEHVANPNFWQHLADRLKVHDIIEAVAADGSFDATLRVIQIDPRKLWVRTRPIHVYIAKPTEIRKVKDNDGYKVEFDGIERWRIIDRSGAVVEKDLPDEAAATEQLDKIRALRPAA